MVKETGIQLNRGARFNKITLKWIKAHAGHLGNEKADQAAKLGASEGALAPPDVPQQPLNALRTNVELQLDKEWNRRWKDREDCRQTKQWFPTSNMAKSYSLLRLDRSMYSKVVQLITGHNHMKRHSSLVNKDEDSVCRLCMEDEETSFHIVAECPALAWRRNMSFGTFEVSEAGTLDWTPTKIVSLIKELPDGLLDTPEVATTL